MNEGQILVVEDEPSIAEVVCLYLRRAHFQVKHVRDGRAALQALEQNIPDLLVLDVMLPYMDGFEIMRWVRQRSEVPVILLTARREEAERIAGLEMGADDYVVKPFSPQELVSRVRAVLRRARPNAEESSDKPLEFGDLRVDPHTRLVTMDEREILLTAKEFDLLWLMARHPRQVYTRQQLLERIWGLSDYIDPSTVTVHVRRLREKLEIDPSNPAHIITLWGVGYKFEP